jgi:hypothetical protein
MTNSTAWSNASTAPQYAVYTGVWTNWARGRVMGSTLTLTRQNGSLLIAFTAFFIGLVASRFWSILALILHRVYSSSNRDALYHQRQAILRNSGSAELALWLFSKLAWAWRKSQSLRRTVPMMICALTSMVAFIIAGGFSSQISSGIANEVLLDGQNCGIVPFEYPPDNISDNAYSSLVAYRGQMTENAANYAQQCYSSGGKGSTLFACNTFRQSHMPSSIDTEASCPFNSSVCRTNSSNIRLDTGFLDSRADFGINSPDDERILYRVVYHCAPLQTAGYSKNQSTGASDNYTAYYYGQSSVLMLSGMNDSYTYRTKSILEQYNLTWKHENPTNLDTVNLAIRFVGDCLYCSRMLFTVAACCLRSD